MAEPDSPIPALFQLSLAAVVEHVKNKKLQISPDHIPLDIHNMLWNDSSVLDLIINTCHPETRVWFSTRVIQPPVITVEFRRNRVGDACLVKIRFENRPTVIWTLASLDWPESPRPKFIIRTGNQYCSSQMDNNNTRFTSRLLHYDRSRFEVINWICKAFRCEIRELFLWHSVDDEFLKWPKLKTARTLRIFEFKKLEVFKELIMERHKNNLRTKFDKVIVTTPPEKKLIQFFDFRSARFNFGDLKINKLIEEYRVLCQRARCVVLARTMDLSIEDIELFKAQLGFSNRATTSMTTNMRMNKKLLVISELKDGKMFKFRFVEKEPGIHNAIIMTVHASIL
ncbi:unnamed protein product [Caenorhabditis brenneri]